VLSSNSRIPIRFLSDSAEVRKVFRCSSVSFSCTKDGLGCSFMLSLLSSLKKMWNPRVNEKAAEFLLLG
jgi:hypothetical protein